MDTQPICKQSEMVIMRPKVFEYQSYSLPDISNGKLSSSGNASAALVVGPDGGVAKVGLEQPAPVSNAAAVAAAGWGWNKQQPQQPMAAMMNGFVPPGGPVQWQQV